MTPYLKRVYENLKELQKNSYVPYSNFKVASICKVGNNFYGGVNIENSSYPCGNCAERSSVCVAVSSGHKKIDEVYIITDSKDIGTPCGQCRQIISEFMENDDQKVVVFNVDGEYKIYTIGELLKDRFTKNHLNNRG